MLGIPLGLLAANATEWVVHKHILHGLGRDKESVWAFHWHEHHRNVRKHGHYDEAYDTHPFRLNGQGKEVAAIVAGAAILTPLLPVAPFFVGTMWYSAVNYYTKHKRSHLDPEWAREKLPWHCAWHYWEFLGCEASLEFLVFEGFLSSYGAWHAWMCWDCDRSFQSNFSSLECLES